MVPDSILTSASSNADVLSIFGNFNDRQKYVRCAVYLDAQLSIGDQTIKSSLLNISPGGAIVQVSQQLLPETDLTMRVDGFDGLECKVIRQNGNKFGLGFSEPADKISKTIHDILGHGIGKENRKLPRRAVMFKANYHTGIRIYKCKIIDISLSGICVKSDISFPSKTEIRIESPRFGDFSCLVAWQKGTLIGLKFLEQPHKIIKRFGHILPHS